jgi:hypothetical protein
MSAYKAGAVALGALIGIAGSLQAEASTVQVPWTGPDRVDFDGSTVEGITFAPINNVFGFVGVDRGAVFFAEESWSLVADINGVWTTLYTDNSFATVQLANIPAISFGAGTLTGIGFSGDDIDKATGLSGAIFSFDQNPTVSSVPLPGSLPMFAAALGVLGLTLRMRGKQLL